jgi:PAS domain S-box-containing protein
MKPLEGTDKGKKNAAGFVKKDSNRSEVTALSDTVGGDILERVTDALIALDSDWNYTFVSERSAEILNRDRASLIGKNVWIEFPELINSPFYHAVHEAMKEQVTVEYDHYFDELHKWVQFRIFPSLSGLTILFVNITIKKMALDILSQREQELKALVENSPDIVARIDSDFRYLYINQAIYCILGLRPEDVVGRTNQELGMMCEDVGFWDKQYKKVFTERKELEIDYEYVLPAKRIVLNSRLIPEMDGEGSVKSILTISRDITTQRDIEKQLIESRRTLETLMNNLPGMVYKCRNDKDWTIEFMSSGCFAISGYYPEDFIDNNKITYNELIHPNDRDFVWNEVQKALSNRKSFEFEYRIINASGEEKWVCEQGSGVFSRDNELLFIEGFITDITKRKISEKALIESEERIARAEDFSLVMLTHVGLDGTWLKVPKSLCQLLGYTEEELLHGKFTDVTHPDDIDQDLALCRKLINGDMKSFDLQKRYITKDGRIVWIELNCSIVKDERDRPVHFITYIRDITERKRMDFALEESEQRFRILFEKSPFAICISRGGIILFMNSSFLKLVGYDDESELIGKNVADLIVPSERDYVLGKITARDEGQEVPNNYELMAMRKDGHLFYIKTELSYIDLPDGQATLSYIKDITESKKAELALKQSELALKEINQDLNTFIYKSSHDLKGPLASIMGLTNVALNEIKDETALYYMKLINQSVYKLDNTLMNLLKMIHIRENSLENCSVNFKELINEILESLHHMPGFNNIQFNLNISEVDFKTDVNTLSSVLQNLIDNSIKYQQKYISKPYINITVSPFHEGVKIEIQDNGVGIPHELQDRVFDMFVRGNQNSKGSGLGLYITKTAVEKLKGTIHLVSESNLGTKFTIYLPSN